jgi:hypothetical protein
LFHFGHIFARLPGYGSHISFRFGIAGKSKTSATTQPLSGKVD